MGHGDYRKHNDGSMNSSTYHKRDGTPVRQLMKREAVRDVQQAAAKGSPEPEGPNASREMTLDELARRWVVCAAVRYPDGTMLVGARHFDSTMQTQYRALGVGFEEKESESGFLDQDGRFMTREEAHRVASAQGQIRYESGDEGGRLFSENLY